MWDWLSSNTFARLSARPNLSLPKLLQHIVRNDLLDKKVGVASSIGMTEQPWRHARRTNIHRRRILILVNGEVALIQATH
jgi:hypothetical protein